MSLTTSLTAEETAPDCGSRSDIGFIAGIATVSEKLIVILDIPRLLNEDRLAAPPSTDTLHEH